MSPVAVVLQGGLSSTSVGFTSSSGTRGRRSLGVWCASRASDYERGGDSLATAFSYAFLANCDEQDLDGPGAQIGDRHLHRGEWRVHIAGKANVVEPCHGHING